MALAFYYDDSQYRAAILPASAVQCLRSNAARDSIYNLWGGGNSVNLVSSTPTAQSGALLMMGRTDELAHSLIYDSGVNNIENIWCSDDVLVVFYFRCHIAGTGALGLAGHTHTVVSVAPLSKYWGHTRQSLPVGQGCNGWWPLYPWQGEADIYNGGIPLAWIRDRVRQVDNQPAFQGYNF
jgi:hypothetical protein